MNKITARAGLLGLSLAELHGLYHETERALTALEPGAVAWRDTLTSLDAISAAISQRRMRGPGF